MRRRKEGGADMKWLLILNHFRVIKDQIQYNKIIIIKIKMNNPLI